MNGVSQVQLGEVETCHRLTPSHDVNMPIMWKAEEVPMHLSKEDHSLKFQQKPLQVANDEHSPCTSRN